MEKIVNIEIKASLSLSSKIKEIDFKSPKNYKPTKKKKDKAN